MGPLGNISPGVATAIERVLLTRGLLLAALALSALRWPEGALLIALVGTGSLCLISSSFDIYVAGVARQRAPALSRVAIMHAVLTLLFGIATLRTPGLSLSQTVSVAAAWLLVAGLVPLIPRTVAALAPRAGVAAARWAMLHLLLLLAILLTPPHSTMAMLYAGAGYAIIIAGAEIAGSIWLHHTSLRPTGAVPA